MIKLKDILNEITLTIKKPSDYSIVELTIKNAGIEFNLDNIDYHLSFHCRYNPYESDVDYTIPILSLSFSTSDKIHTSKESEMTNSNIPFKLFSNLLGCIEIWAEQYKKKFVSVNKTLNVTAIYFKPAQEQRGDLRREKIYIQYFENYAKMKNSKMTYNKTIGGIQCNFEPELTW